MTRSFYLFVILLTLSFTTVLAAEDGNWVSLNGSSSAQKPTATILKSDDSETLIKFNTNGFWSQDVEVDGTTYQLLKFPGYASTLEVGQAQIPAISELVAIPGHANVTVEIVESREVTLTGFRVFPFQEPQLETAVDPGFSVDADFYSRNALFPADQATVGSPGIWRDLRVVNLRVHPLQHNPVTGEIRACSEIIVRLTYAGTSSVNVKEPLQRPVAENFDRMYSQAVLNYKNLNLPVSQSDLPADKFTGAYDYLIIADDNYVGDMTDFIDWKTAQGLAVNIIPVSEVGSTYTLIKNFIADEYTSNGIRYVLLVGDENDIPAYEGYGFFSDYYYSTLEGSDDYAEIAIGRFCVGSSEHVGNMVNKSIVFESSPPGGDWLEKSLLVANYELAPDKYQYCKEEVRNADDTNSGSYNVLYPQFTTAYGASISNGGDEATNADVINYFNEGFRLVNYRGHGDTDIWWSWNVDREHFEISDVEAIDNGQYTPVVFSIACLNNELDSNNLTIGEAFTQDNDAAVAFLGASSPSYTTPNHDYDKQLYAVIFDEGINALGDASNEASVRVIGLWGSYGIANARMYLWLGDPSLQLIFSGTPGLPAPQLASPADGSSFDSPATVLLDWNTVDTAVSYDVQLDDSSDFSSPLSEAQGLTASQWTTAALGDGVYYWRARAYDGTDYSPWSSGWSFSVGVQMAAPVLISPAKNARLRTTNITFEWYALDGVDSYRIDVSTDPTFSAVVIAGTSGTCSDGICSFTSTTKLDPATYYWRVQAMNDGWPWSEVWSFRMLGTGGGGGGGPKDGPDVVELDGNYPNPFNPMTSIHFRLPESMPVQLRVYDVSGRLMRTLLADQVMPAGLNEVVWDGKDSSGRGAASGIYFYQLEADKLVMTKRMILLK